ncbi:MAG: hypothetical protein OSA84_00470 [Akkermansiaceae bacterium]|nr:hypothetical protein [Akkermansiaceae bacterium]
MMTDLTNQPLALQLDILEAASTRSGAALDKAVASYEAKDDTLAYLSSLKK